MGKVELMRISVPFSWGCKSCSEKKCRVFGLTYTKSWGINTLPQGFAVVASWPMGVG